MSNLSVVVYLTGVNFVGLDDHNSMASEEENCLDDHNSMANKEENSLDDHNSMASREDISTYFTGRNVQLFGERNWP